MSTILKDHFFNRPTLEVAKGILGKSLCRKLDDGTITRHCIIEVEAYDGPGDKACHGAKGLTPRTEVMFGPAGHWYVYLCYGIHWMLNIVTGPKDYPAALLIRGLNSVSGPGRLTRSLGINKSFNGLASSPNSRLWIESSPENSEKLKIKRTPRIGIDYAGPKWAAKPYRFIIDNL